MATKNNHNPPSTTRVVHPIRMIPFLCSLLLATATITRTADAISFDILGNNEDENWEDTATSETEVPTAGPSEIFSSEEGRIVVTNQAMGARCAVAADFDGDGRMDLVSASSNDNAVSWYQNLGNDATTGQPMFGIKRKITWSSLGSRIVTVADINMDGHVDVIGASYYDSSLRWFENDGTGEFTEHLISAGVNEGQGVTVADFNNDGLPDIATASSGDNTIAVFQNLGNGHFCEIKQIVDHEAIGARTVVAADLNGDGWIDLASASKDDDTVAWYPNDGTGHFPTKIVISAGNESKGAYSLVAADIDQDGHEDLIVASNGNDHVSLWRNDGNATSFTKTLIYGEADFVLSVTAVDFDRDGDLDVASASFFDGYIRWYENVDGQGRVWKNHTVYIGTQGHYVSTADMDGDGDDDLIAVTHAENTVAVFLARTECDGHDDMKGGLCCHEGTQWNGTSCEVCGQGTYGVGSGIGARCEACPNTCTIPGLNVVPATCAGITGYADANASIALCSCPVDHIKDPDTDACAKCPAGQYRPDPILDMLRGVDTIGNYTAWELQQGVCALPEVEEDLNQIDGIVPYGLALMSIAFALSIYFAGWTTYYRTERIVRASQPFFLIMITAGTAVMSSAILPFGIDDKNFTDEACSVACMSAPWLVCTGFTISFSALFSKLYRINQVMRASHRKIKVTEWDVLKPFAVLFTVNLIVLTIWSVMDPLTWLRQPLKDGQPWETYGSCHFDGTISIVCAILLAIIALTSLVLACMQAYMTRTIGDEYSESKFIGIAVICWLQVLLVGLPLLFLMRGNPAATYFLKTGIIFVVSTSLLLLVFVPKVIQKNQAPKKRRSTFKVSGLSIQSGCLQSEFENFNNSTSSFNHGSFSNMNSHAFGLGQQQQGGSSPISKDSQSSSIGMAIVSPQLEIEDLRAEIRELKSENRDLRFKNRKLDEMLQQVYEPLPLPLEPDQMDESMRIEEALPALAPDYSKLEEIRDESIKRRNSSAAQAAKRTGSKMVNWQDDSDDDDLDDDEDEEPVNWNDTDDSSNTPTDQV